MSDLRCGGARASIAPLPEHLAGGVYLGGFGSYRQRRATGVHDEVACAALALADGATTVVIASLDLVGATGSLLAAIRDDASRLTRIPASNILVACTHSHASPDTQGLWGGVPSAYMAHVAHRASTAIWQAVEAMTPVSAAAATTSLGGVVRNRRGWPETDETLTALRFDDTSGGPVATFVNYACHPVASGSANTEVSRDWCGYTTDVIERERGGVAVYVNGAIGDVNPAVADGFDSAARLGETVARAALAALGDARPVDGRLGVRTERLLLPLNFERLSARVQDAAGRAGPALSVLTKTGGLPAAALALYKAGRPDLAQLVSALSGFGEHEMVRRHGHTHVVTHCGHVRLGDNVEGIAAPGEVLTRLALPLRASMQAPHRLFFGLTHDTLGYFIPEDEWMTGRNNNYEESVSFGRRAGVTLADALLSLLSDGNYA